MSYLLRVTLIIFVILLSYNFTFAQNLEDEPNDPRFGMNYLEYQRPFYHGVASGDPMNDRVIIWTRVSTESVMEVVDVEWFVATDVDMMNIIQSGNLLTNAERDFTVKVDVMGLEPGKTYYYMFKAKGRNSVIGRTKTLPVGETDRVKFAHVTCSHFGFGYFNAYRQIAEKNDIDALIHMGDYTYEYSSTNYFSPWVQNRNSYPDRETVSLKDYRERLYQYHLDYGLQRARQQHPFITMWDDHETANDSWMGGAENHDPETEGDWDDRVDRALQAYYEWLPVREVPGVEKREYYRSYTYGDLFTLYTIETRLTGRMEQIFPKGQGGEIDEEEWLDPNRTMLGHTQLDWLLGEMGASETEWNVIQSSVMMVPVFGFLNFDAWDGYPAERMKIFNYVEQNDVKNFGVFSGDFHMAFAFNLTYTANDENYNPMTGEGAVGFEFTTPSISAANLNEQTDFEGLNLLAMDLPERSEIALGTEAQFSFINNHMKYINTDQHGYVLYDITKDKLQANYYYMDDIRSINGDEQFAHAVYVENGSKRLIATDQPSTPEPRQDAMTPIYPIIDFNLEDKTVCYGDNVELGTMGEDENWITAFGGSGDLTLMWTPTNGLDLSNPMNPIFIEAKYDRTIFLTAIDNETGKQRTASIFIEVEELPNVDMPLFVRADKDEMVDLNSYISVEGDGVYSYNWIDEDGLEVVNGEVSKGAGLYRYFLSITNENGCKTPDRRLIVFRSFRKGILEGDNLTISENGNLVAEIYPNPVKDKLSVVCASSAMDINTIKVLDLSGKSMIQNNVKNTDLLEESIDVQNLNSGAYILVIESEKESISIKFVKN